MKVVLITGASKGIGKSIARLYLEKGFIVWAFNRSVNKETYKELSCLAESYKSKYFEKTVDITDEKQCRNSLKDVIEESGKVDILINNAGITDTSLFLMTSLKRMRTVFETNFFANMFLSQIVVRYMIKNGGGSIINVASVTGMRPIDGAISYGASKSALIYSTQVMAKELGQYNIRVNAVCPGFIDTDMWKNRDDAAKQAGIEKSALKRMGTPSEVARTVYFLSSEEASYITGGLLVVDGGMRIV